MASWLIRLCFGPSLTVSYIGIEQLWKVLCPIQSIALWGEIGSKQITGYYCITWLVRTRAGRGGRVQGMECAVRNSVRKREPLREESSVLGNKGKAVIRVSTAAQQRSLRSEAAGPCGLWKGLWLLLEMSVEVTEGLSRKVTWFDLSFKCINFGCSFEQNLESRKGRDRMTENYGNDAWEGKS